MLSYATNDQTQLIIPHMLYTNILHTTQVNILHITNIPLSDTTDWPEEYTKLSTPAMVTLT